MVIQIPEEVKYEGILEAVFSANTSPVSAGFACCLLVNSFNCTMHYIRVSGPWQNHNPKKTAPTLLT